MVSRKNSLRMGMTLMVSVLIGFGPIHSFAAIATTTYLRPTAPDVYLTELQTASLNSAGEEFIELYNDTGNDIDLADTAHSGKDAWKLQYFSSSKLASLLGAANWASPTRTINLTGTIPAHDYYVVAAGTYQPGNLAPDQTYSSTLADDGGAVQLVDSGTTGTNTLVTVHDQLAWSTDKTLPVNTLLYSAPGAGVSLQRKPNTDSEYVNEDNTLTGFTADTAITPANAWIPPAPVVPVDPNSGDTSDPTDGSGSTVTPPVVGNIGLDHPIISELLPNPASPQTDENDEYIELYNPNDSPFDLDGYTLQTGSATLHDFTFTSQVLVDPHGFRAFYSADTGLSLSNSGGQARLLDASQAVVDQSDTYGTASDGQAWALGDDGNWAWTLTPTPGAVNVMHAPAVKVSVIKTASKTTRKATAGKVKGVTTTKKKATKAKKKAAKTSGTALTSTTTPPAPAPIHPQVLVAVAVLAVGYMSYEYRKDVANYIYKFRANRAARRTARG